MVFRIVFWYGIFVIAGGILNFIGMSKCRFADREYQKIKSTKIKQSIAMFAVTAAYCFAASCAAEMTDFEPMIFLVILLFAYTACIPVGIVTNLYNYHFFQTAEWGRFRKMLLWLSLTLPVFDIFVLMVLEKFGEKEEK